MTVHRNVTQAMDLSLCFDVVCKFKAHKRCAVRAVNNCKWTTLTSIGKDILEDEDGVRFCQENRQEKQPHALLLSIFGAVKPHDRRLGSLSFVAA